MKLLLLCCSLVVIYSCSNNKYELQQETAENFIKAIYDGDILKVKTLIVPDNLNGMDPFLFNANVKRSHNLLRSYGLPAKKTYTIRMLSKNDPNYIEIDVPIFNKEQKKISTIQLFFEKSLSEKQLWFFIIKQEAFDNRVIEAPK